MNKLHGFNSIIVLMIYEGNFEILWDFFEINSKTFGIQLRSVKFHSYVVQKCHFTYCLYFAKILDPLHGISFEFDSNSNFMISGYGTESPFISEIFSRCCGQRYLWIIARVCHCCPGDNSCPTKLCHVPSRSKVRSHLYITYVYFLAHCLGIIYYVH